MDSIPNFKDAGKHLNKVKLARAREMVGFVRESLNKTATGPIEDYLDLRAKF